MTRTDVPKIKVGDRVRFVGEFDDDDVAATGRPWLLDVYGKYAQGTVLSLESEEDGERWWEIRFDIAPVQSVVEDDDDRGVCCDESELVLVAEVPERIAVSSEALIPVEDLTKDQRRVLRLISPTILETYRVGLKKATTQEREVYPVEDVLGYTVACFHDPDGQVVVRKYTSDYVTSDGRRGESHFFLYAPETDNAPEEGATLKGGYQVAKAKKRTAKAAKKTKGRRTRSTVQVLGYDLSSLAVWFGAHGLTTDDAMAVLEGLKADLSSITIKGGPRKYVNDRMWYGRKGRMQPADVTKAHASKIDGIVVKFREAQKVAKAKADKAKKTKAAAKKKAPAKKAPAKKKA